MRIVRHKINICRIGGLLAVLLCATAHSCGILLASQKHITVETSPFADKYEKDAAQILIDFIGLSNAPFAEKHKISLVNKRENDILKSAYVEIKVEKNDIKLIYGSSDNAQTAVGEFARNFLGLALYAPPPLGIEKLPMGKIDGGSLRREFSFAGRMLGIMQKEARLYDAANGDNRAYYASGHTLTYIVGREAAKKNPDWMAMRNSVRLTYDMSSQAQIDFLNPDVREYVADYAENFFNKNPQRKILSISCADSYLFDNTEKSKKHIGGYNQSDYIDHSDLVFGFVKSVADKIAKKHPEKFVAEMAYLYTESPPSFKMPKNSAVYLCADRNNNFDGISKNKDMELLDKWRNSGVGLLGIYDYNYGMQYFVPRNNLKTMAEAIKYSREKGARLYTSESTPLWAYDAHKMWVMSNLLKDADSDAESLKKEFFDNYYKSASANIRKFFDIAESAWLNRRDKPFWLKLFKRESQAELFPPETIQSMERELSAAERMKNPPIVRERIAEIRLVFDITKAFVDFYAYQKRLFKSGENNAQKTTDLIEASDIAETRKRLAIERYENNTKYPKADFKIWEKISFIDNRIPACADLLDFSGSKKFAEKRLGEKKADGIAKIKNGKNILKNSGFENGFIHWVKFKPNASKEKLRIVEKNSVNGKYSAEMQSKNFVGLTQYAAVSSGKTYLFSATINGRLNLGDVCYSRISFLDADSKVISSSRNQLPAGEFYNSVRLRIFEQAPKNAVKAAVSIFVGNMHPENSLLIDDVELVESGD